MAIGCLRNYTFILRSIPLVCLAAFLASTAVFAQDEKPIPVSICDLQSNPDVYNHKRIQVQGTISHEFESFGIYDTGCSDSKSSPWLMYGGNEADEVIYCCNGTGRKNRVEIEGIEVPIRQDQTLNRFRKLVNSYRINKKAKMLYFQTDPSFSVTATLVGRFFAGDKQGEKMLGRGFGHMGCCTLLVIEQVLSIDKIAANIKPGELSYYNEAWHDDSSSEDLAAKHNKLSQAGEKWRTKDFQRVAMEALLGNLTNSRITLKFGGCKTMHLTYPDKQDDQYRAYCFWSSSPTDSYSVEVAKYYFLKNKSNRWKDILWMPSAVTYEHRAECKDPETCLGTK